MFTGLVDLPTKFQIEKSEAQASLRIQRGWVKLFFFIAVGMFIVKVTIMITCIS